MPGEAARRRAVPPQAGESAKPEGTYIRARGICMVLKGCRTMHKGEELAIKFGLQLNLKHEIQHQDTGKGKHCIRLEATNTFQNCCQHIPKKEGIILPIPPGPCRSFRTLSVICIQENLKPPMSYPRCSHTSTGPRINSYTHQGAGLFSSGHFSACSCSQCCLCGLSERKSTQTQ